MHETLGVFLVDQRRRLSLRTYKAYEAVIDDLAMFLYDHGAESLLEGERALLETRTLPCGCVEDNYLQSFGPEHLLRNLDRFVAPCRGPVRIEDRQPARMALRVMRTLRTWLTNGGWIGRPTPGSARARTDFDLGRRLTKTLGAAIEALDLDNQDLGSDDDLLESGLLDVSRIHGDDLWFHHWPDRGPVLRDIGPVRLPAAAAALQPGWVVGGTLGRVHGAWQLLHISCVYTIPGSRKPGGPHRPIERPGFGGA